MLVEVLVVLDFEVEVEVVLLLLVEVVLVVDVELVVEVLALVLDEDEVVCVVVVDTTTEELVDINELNSYRSSLFPAPQNSEELPVQTMLQSEIPFGAGTPPFEMTVSQ